MEIVQVISTVLEIGLPAVLLWQLWQVWNRLNVVTDKLISLTADFEEYREQSELYRADVQRQLKAQGQ